MKIFVAEKNEISLKAFVDGLSQRQPMVVEGSVGLDEVAVSWLRDECDTFDALVLAEDMGDNDGIDVLRILRRAGCHAPVIILLDNSKLRMEEAFQAGADDVILKPVKMTEVTMRIQAVVRRRFGYSEPRVVANNLVIYLDGRNPVVSGHELRLTSREAAILECLALRQGRVASRDLLHEHLYGMDDEREINIKTIDVHICHLRRRLTGAGASLCIETVNGRGYRLVAAMLINGERNLCIARNPAELGADEIEPVPLSENVVQITGPEKAGRRRKQANSPEASKELVEDFDESARRLVERR